MCIRDRAYRSRYMRVLRGTVYTLLVVAAVAVLLATLFLPVLQVSGDSMNPTLQDRDIILLVKDSDMKTGDLCGFYWQNKLLLKRIIGDVYKRQVQRRAGASLSATTQAKTYKSG